MNRQCKNCELLGIRDAEMEAAIEQLQSDRIRLIEERDRMKMALVLLSGVRPKNGMMNITEVIEIAEIGLGKKK